MPHVFWALIGFSIFALAGALVAQYVFGLAPCPLCVYQRIPYFLAIFIGLLGAYAYKTQRTKLAYGVVGILGLTFLSNSIIAAFHTGVERKWWQGLEGCSAPDMSGSMTDILARIKAAPIIRCDVIPWADPIFGFSMANYNVAACLGAALVCGVVLWRGKCA
jgi:disulfide bond formation protein DsbB